MSASAAGLWCGKEGKKVKCERCVFRAQASAGYRCDYCAITGHTRLAVPPEKCLHFQKGERIDRSEEKAAPLGVEALRTMGRQSRKSRGGSKPKYDWERGRQLYAQGKNDREIGKELGCDPHTVYLWRKKSGLAANAGARGKTVRQVSQGESGMGK